MAKTLPPKMGLDLIYYNDLVKLAKKEHDGKTLTAGEEKRRRSDLKKLAAHGYTSEQVTNYIVSRLGDRSGKVSFGAQDIKVANPVDTARLLLDKAKAGALLSFLGNITDPHTWLRVAFIILGGILFLGGLGMLLKELGAARIAKKLPVAKAVTG